MSVRVLSVAHDPDWTLAKWATFIASLRNGYPDDTRLCTDAGANNVSLYLVVLSKAPDKLGGTCPFCGDLLELCACP